MEIQQEKTILSGIILQFVTREAPLSVESARNHEQEAQRPLLSMKLALVLLLQLPIAIGDAPLPPREKEDAV